MLEVVAADFTKLAELIAAEEKAIAEYESESRDNALEKVAKEKDVEYKSKEATGLDKAVVEATGERSGVQAELDAVLEYLGKLNKMCIAKAETYGERKRRREAELAGLREALRILDGTSVFVKEEVAVVKKTVVTEKSSSYEVSSKSSSSVTVSSLLQTSARQSVATPHI